MTDSLSQIAQRQFQLIVNGNNQPYLAGGTIPDINIKQGDTSSVSLPSCMDLDPSDIATITVELYDVSTSALPFFVTLSGTCASGLSIDLTVVGNNIMSTYDMRLKLTDSFNSETIYSFYINVNRAPYLTSSITTNT